MVKPTVTELHQPLGHLQREHVSVVAIWRYCTPRRNKHGCLPVGQLFSLFVIFTTRQRSCGEVMFLFTCVYVLVSLRIQRQFGDTRHGGETDTASCQWVNYWILWVVEPPDSRSVDVHQNHHNL